ncbi:GntR family transcriptional regulator [Gordonia alkaliphila]|uniref:GntR family transcriptional regulator n=1 Tax=Gordonia alkaliphila TaxID=1053547 RepID=A0ABP8Z447_9ACTN|nr:GntR family transcriptional regulator [Gordonia alkaliphila]MCK0438003.1 GntR family transcriptional regulator [Gordonia alkaliphila]
MLFRLRPDSDDPLFTQLADAVRAQLCAGRLAPGDRLPAAREVADALEVNVHTVLRAYQDLRDEGLVELRRGRGAVVTDAGAHLQSLNDDIAALIAKSGALSIHPETLSALVKEAARAHPAPPEP